MKLMNHFHLANYRSLFLPLRNMTLLVLFAGLHCARGQAEKETNTPELPSLLPGQICTIRFEPAAKADEKLQTVVKNRIKFADGILEETLQKKEAVSATWYVFEFKHPAFPGDAFVASSNIPAGSTSFQVVAHDPAIHPNFQSSDFPELDWLKSSSPAEDEVFEGMKCHVFEGQKEISSRDTNGNLVVETGDKVRAGLDSKTGRPVFMKDDSGIHTYQFADKDRAVELPPELRAQLDLLEQNLLRLEQRGRLIP